MKKTCSIRLFILGIIIYKTLIISKKYNLNDSAGQHIKAEHQL